MESLSRIPGSTAGEFGKIFLHFDDTVAEAPEPDHELVLAPTGCLQSGTVLGTHYLGLMPADPVAALQVPRRSVASDSLQPWE